MYVFMYVCMYMYVCVCMYIYVCVCMYVCICMYVCTHVCRSYLITSILIILPTYLQTMRSVEKLKADLLVLYLNEETPEPPPLPVGDDDDDDHVRPLDGR